MLVPIYYPLPPRPTLCFPELSEVKQFFRKFNMWLNPSNANYYQREYSPHCSPHISYAGTGEENVLNNRDFFHIVDHSLSFCRLYV